MSMNSGKRLGKEGNSSVANSGKLHWFQWQERKHSVARKANAGKAPPRVLSLGRSFPVGFGVKRVWYNRRLVQLTAYKPKKPQPKPNQTGS
jgi:hypothetical protein